MNFDNLQGYYYKTLTVTTSLGVRQYPIASNYDLGLPEDSIILGMFVRRLPDGPGSGARSQNGKPIVRFEVNRNSFITIKDRQTETVIYRYNYALMQRSPVYFTKKIAAGIDWSNSILEISPNCADANIVDGEDFELILIYAPCDSYITKENFRLRSGSIHENYQYNYTQIPLTTGFTTYNLSRQNNIGLDEKFYLVGLDIRRPNPFNGIVPSRLNCAFLTLKRKTYNYVENLPLLLDGYPQINWDKPYIPINPIKMGEMDWNNSTLTFTDPAGPTTGQTFTVGLIYVVK
jgi:hypothetical protein